jgi:uncharacterized LabA/DUF88 family protein
VGHSAYRYMHMRVRRIAVLIDGAFFLKRLPRLVPPHFCTTPRQVADSARNLCKRHVLRITRPDVTRNAECLWLDHVYRLFYYDALPYDGVSHHPVLNRRIEFEKTEAAAFRKSLFSELRSQRKFALRLGKVAKEGDWQLSPRLTRQVLRIGKWLENFDPQMLRPSLNPRVTIDELRLRDLEQIIATWRKIEAGDVRIELRQKGVDMRIGLDIASMTLKRQVDTIVLVTGDSDFVPAAKLARREGVELLIDPLWQRVSDELGEHVDGIASVFPRPANESSTLIAAA